MVKLLIADDNKQITSILKEYSEKDGYEAVVAYDGEQALQEFGKDKFDLILLDVMMPKKDGFEVCREIRKVSSIPIIMVTARGEDFERIMGLDIGADDYIVKPFSIRELLARIEAVLRRSPERPRQLREIRIPGATLDSVNRLITFKDGRETSLTAREFE